MRRKNLDKQYNYKSLIINCIITLQLPQLWICRAAMLDSEVGAVAERLSELAIVLHLKSPTDNSDSQTCFCFRWNQYH